MDRFRILLLAFVLLLACDKQPATIAVTGVTLDKSFLELVEGDKATLVASVKPANASDQSVTWSCSDNSVAMVSSGQVTALKAGTATVTVTTVDGGKSATCKVTVKAKTYPVTGVSLDKTSLTMTEGNTENLTATITPSNATNKNVKWSTSDKSVATVADGKVTAVKAGTATITVTTEDGSKTASCKVTVKAKEVPTITVSQTNYTVAGKGGTVALQITANIDYTITTTAGWITISGTTLTVAANTSTDARTAVVTIANSTYGKSVDVSIKQNGLNGLEDGDKIVTP